MFHTKDLGTKHLDYNIRLALKTKFKDHLADFAGTDKFCYNCKTLSNIEIKETFLHACYTCPHINVLINNISCFFNMDYNLKAKEVLLYKAYPDRKNSFVDINRSLAFQTNNICSYVRFMLVSKQLTSYKILASQTPVLQEYK